MTRRPATDLFRLADSIDVVNAALDVTVEELNVYVEKGDFTSDEKVLLEAWVWALKEMQNRVEGIVAGCRDAAKGALPREQETNRRRGPR